MSGAVTLTVRLTPRAARDAIDGLDDAGVLRVHVRAAPVDGRANAALVGLMADALGVPPSSVRLLSGAGGRVKRLSVTGATDEAMARLGIGPGRRRTGR